MPIGSLLPPRPLKAGVYLGTVLEASLQCHEWRATRANPSGLSVRVIVEVKDDDGPAHITDGIDVDHTERLQRLFASAGLTYGGDTAQLDELVDCELACTVKNITPRQGLHAGLTKACIAGYVLDQGKHTPRRA